jgi:hypothetical protein
MWNDWIRDKQKDQFSVDAIKSCRRGHSFDNKT